MGTKIKSLFTTKNMSFEKSRWIQAMIVFHEMLNIPVCSQPQFMQLCKNLTGNVPSYSILSYNFPVKISPLPLPQTPHSSWGGHNGQFYPKNETKQNVKKKQENCEIKFNWCSNVSKDINFWKKTLKVEICQFKGLFRRSGQVKKQWNWVVGIWIAIK